MLFFSISGCSKYLVQVLSFVLGSQITFGLTSAMSSFVWKQCASFSLSGEGACDMQLYAGLFRSNHITGKMLLLLTENDMRDMGVKSKGHAMHLKASYPWTQLSLVHTGCDQDACWDYSELCIFSFAGWNWKANQWLPRLGPLPASVEGTKVSTLLSCMFCFYF